MITSNPVELGKASEETKGMGPGPGDHPGSMVGEFVA
jgi:hypothetical protein